MDGDQQDQRKTGMGVKVVLGLLGVVLLVAGGFTLLSSVLRNARERVYDPHCTSGLWLVGKTCELYAKENNGEYPTDLRVLVDAGRVPATALMCKAIAKEDRDYGSPPYNDYQYFGKGLKVSEINQPDKTVLAWEPAPIHPDGTMAVLFVSGRVAMVSGSSIEEIAETSGWVIPAAK